MHLIIVPHVFLYLYCKPINYSPSTLTIAGWLAGEELLIKHTRLFVVNQSSSSRRSFWWWIKGWPHLLCSVSHITAVWTGRQYRVRRWCRSIFEMTRGEKFNDWLVIRWIRLKGTFFIILFIYWVSNICLTFIRSILNRYIFYPSDLLARLIEVTCQL